MTNSKTSKQPVKPDVEAPNTDRSSQVVMLREGLSKRRCVAHALLSRGMDSELEVETVYMNMPKLNNT